MTKNMQKFIEKNKQSAVVFGDRRTPENKSVHTAQDMERSDRVFYRFDDGTSITLKRTDLESSPGFSPRWALS